MNRRGHTLPLIMLVLAMSAVAMAVFWTRYSKAQHGWYDDELRAQALWLARSALAVDTVGSRDVQTDQGLAQVEVNPRAGTTTVVVDLGGARATISSDPYSERFVAAAAAR